MEREMDSTSDKRGRHFSGQLLTLVLTLHKLRPLRDTLRNAGGIGRPGLPTSRGMRSRAGHQAPPESVGQG